MNDRAAKGRETKIQLTYGVRQTVTQSGWQRMASLQSNFRIEEKEIGRRKL